MCDPVGRSSSRPAVLATVPGLVAGCGAGRGRCRRQAGGRACCVIPTSASRTLCSRMPTTCGWCRAPVAKRFRLTSPEGFESSPRFSPDGETLAFVGNYDGARDIYTISVKGGVPQRLTYHPAGKLLCDWTPDGGAVVYDERLCRVSARLTQMFVVSEKNPLPTQLPVAYGDNGAISPDGQWLAFTPYSADMRTWKRYRGGMASDIWLFNLENKTAQRMTEWEGTDSIPMWHGQTVYYSVRRGRRTSVEHLGLRHGHRCAAASDSLQGVRREVAVDRTGRSRARRNRLPARCRPVPARPGNQPIAGGGGHDPRRPAADHAADGQRGGLSWPVRISHRPDRAWCVEARGDIWSLPAKNGSPRNMTRTSGVAERDPSWSPDGTLDRLPGRPHGRIRTVHQAVGRQG